MRRQTLSIPRPLNRTVIRQQEAAAKEATASTALSGLAAYSDVSESDNEDEPKVVAAEPVPIQEEDDFAAFMADINSSTSSLNPPLPPEPTSNEPTPIPPDSSFSTPLILPELSKFSSSPLVPPPKTSQLHSRLERVLARVDQLPALPVNLPPSYTAIIENKRLIFDTRCSDWKRGGLVESFFADILTNFEAQVDILESLYNPKGWTIHWDEATESHYFECTENGSVSWSWPAIPPLPPSQPPLPDGDPPIQPETLETKSPTETNQEPPPCPESPQQNQPTKKTKKITRPETVSISAKSRKMASMLQQWHIAKSELREAEIEESKDPEELEFERLQNWAETQSNINASNPNFAPVGVRKRQRPEEDVDGERQI
ncbi:hypothetical protein HDU79_001966 [Rhizoclosmatium sp. JEL0117]|nr:hypothetical protein HDU79_001966 [Rhizoclosmatium sp. JEL0117]